MYALNDEKIRAIIDVMENNPEVLEIAENGLGCVAAGTEKLFGSELKGSLWYKDKNIITRLFNTLMSLDVPPGAVFIGDCFCVLIWYPIGKMPITSMEHYTDLYIQFQKYLDSITEIDLRIQFCELTNSYPMDDDEEIIKESPYDFSKENFDNHGTIVFMEFWGDFDQYSLQYDNTGKIVYYDGEAFND